jgi:radical SAM superfamily enzyme YgiQ (UPF0313 family)
MTGAATRRLRRYIKMKYEGIVIRPPSEAGSLILQVTLGCSHNRCTFCPTYKGKRFRIRSLEEIREDLDGARRYRGVRRVFLADGDALIVPQRMLVPVLTRINEAFPDIERIGVYGNAKSILKKSPDELNELKELGLGIVYLGLESGDPRVLDEIQKGTGVPAMIEAAHRVREAGILLSVTVLVGIAGKERSIIHAEQSGKVLSEMNPDYIGALTVMVVPGTPLAQRQERGEFVLPDTRGFLEELGALLAHTDVTDCLFTSNHASNYLPLRIRLSQEKEQALSIIEHVLSQNRTDLLRPEHLRGL